MRLSATLALLFSLAVQAAPKPEPLEAKVAALAEAALGQGNAGVQIAVLQQGRAVINGAWGKANVELGVPLTLESQMKIGSITKQFTAAAVLRLVEQEKLRLDQPLSDLLPDYPLQGRLVTVRHLLTHTSGIQNYTASPEFWTRDSFLPLDPYGVVELFKQRPFDFEPGARFSYSNSGYHLLGLVLEKAAGKPWAQAVHGAGDRACRPCNHGILR